MSTTAAWGRADRLGLDDLQARRLPTAGLDAARDPVCPVRVESRGYHVTSLWLHCGVAVVLYALTATILVRVLRPCSASDCTALLAGSSLAAILFAVHPLRVEVVAWVSCQPYLPCALCSLLSILAYLRAFDDSGARRLGWVVASWLFFLLALLSKAVAVTLPAVLVILDIALLRRIGPGTWTGPSSRRVWLEKVPFLALSVVFQVIAILAKQSNDSLGLDPEFRRSGPGDPVVLRGRVLPGQDGLAGRLVRLLSIALAGDAALDH